MGYIKEEFKKLFPIGLLILAIFYQSIPTVLVLFGLFLLIEHRYSYGRWDVKDILGHETLGIVLLCSGLLIVRGYWGVVIALSTYLVFGNYKWEKKKSPIKYAWDKVNVK